MTTATVTANMSESEKLKTFIELAKEQLKAGIINQSELDRFEEGLKYTVSAGGYDGEHVSTDYIDAFVSIEDAMVALKKYGSDQPWSRIELRDGEFVYEIDPVRIMRRDPETGFFNPCDEVGNRIINLYENEETEVPMDQPFDMHEALEMLADVHSENDVTLTLSGFPLRLIHSMALQHNFNTDAHMQSCEELARDLDTVELRQTLMQACKRFGIS